MTTWQMPRTGDLTPTALYAVGPEQVALVLAAHGDLGDRAKSNPNAANSALLEHQARLHAQNLFRAVSAGVLKGEPTLEDALTGALDSDPRRLIVFPFFMADGYFVKSVLAQRLTAFSPKIPYLVCSPLGLNGNLIPLIASQSEEAASNAQISAQEARLLLVGHGSKHGPASANATRAAAKRLSDQFGDRFSEIDVAFLEEAPFLNDQIQAGIRPTIVCGFFNGDGLHAGQDVPDAVHDAPVQTVYAGPIGRIALIADYICDAALDVLRRAGQP